MEASQYLLAVEAEDVAGLVLNFLFVLLVIYLLTFKQTWLIASVMTPHLPRRLFSTSRGHISALRPLFLQILKQGSQIMSFGSFILRDSEIVLRWLRLGYGNLGGCGRL